MESQRAIDPVIDGEGNGDSSPAVSRRDVIVSGGALVAAAGVAVATGACAIGPSGRPAGSPPEPATGTPPQRYYPDVPQPPDTPPAPGVLKALTAQEARTVDAIAARLMPGSAADPGAREAGVVTYIDNKLAFHNGTDRPTY